MGTWRIYIYLTFFFINILLVSSTCDFECKDNDDKYVITLHCKDDVQFNKEEWSCLESDSVFNIYDYGNIKPVIDVNYELDLYASLSLHNYAESNLDRLSEEKDHITILSIENGTFFTIPETFYGFTAVREMRLHDLNILTVDLHRFVDVPKLTVLYLDNNKIHKIDNSYDVGTKMSSLTILHLSVNYLEEIPNNCFTHFPQLKTLKLSGNSIRSLDILNFEGMSQLVILDISNNKLLSLDNALARFINLKELYLQNNLILKLFDFNFVSLTNLEKLNLSSNRIDTIENNTFKSLTKLNYLNLNHNYITIINKKIFKYNNQLSSLSISHNNIEHVENLAFDNKNITHFEFENIRLKGSIQKLTFKGIYTDEMNLSGGKIDNLQDDAFEYICDRLNLLNVSHNEITTISHNAFNCLEHLTDLDLSHNHLKVINFNTNSLKNLTYLYLKNNSIENIQQSTFKNLTTLNKLDLSFNSIEKTESKSISDLTNLQHLILSNNIVDNLENNTFDGLVSLRSIDLTFTRLTTFSNNIFNGLTSLTSINSSHAQLSTIEYDSFINTGAIEVLDLSYIIIQIFNVNTSTIYTVKYLYLNNNDLRFVNNNTFSGFTALRNMSNLIILDLSSNYISFIQPGSFLTTKKLAVINLSANFIQTLQYGVFDGLYLRSLNLSNNALKYIDSKVFPNIESLYLDNNDIKNINFQEFLEKEILKLSIGGNKISCKVLVELKTLSDKYASVITTQYVNYHSENVDGISCESVSNDTQLILPITNGTSYDVKPLFSKLMISIDLLRKSINTNVFKELIRAFNEGQNAYIEFLYKTLNGIQQFIMNAEDLNNITNQNLKEYVTNMTQINKLYQNNTALGTTVIDNNVKTEIDKLREELIDSLNNVNQKQPMTDRLTEDQRVKNSHTDTIFYFMSACLAVIVMLYSFNIYFTYTKRQRINFSNFQNSANPLQMNDLE